MLSSIITKVHTVHDTRPSALPSICQLSASAKKIDNFLYHRQFLFILYFVCSYNLSSTFGSSSALCRISLKQWLIKSQHSFKGGSKTILGSSTLSLTVSIWGTKNCISWYGSVKSLPSLGKRMKIVHAKEISCNYNILKDSNSPKSLNYTAPMGSSSLIFIKNTDVPVHKILRCQLLNESIKVRIRKLDLSLIALIFP